MVLSELTPLGLWQPIARSEGFMVVEQQGYLGNGGFTFDYDVLVLNAILADTQATWNVDTRRIHLTGFSAGAHWSYVVGLANSDQFAGLGISAGSMATAIRLGVWPSQVTTKIAVAIRHGTQDTVVPVSEGRAANARLTAAGHPVDYAEFTGGHVVRTLELSEIWAFLKDKRRP
jgi:phospholipase/carboxylesterase